MQAHGIDMRVDDRAREPEAFELGELDLATLEQRAREAGVLEIGRSAWQMPAGIAMPEPELAIPRTASPGLVEGSRLVSIRIPAKSAIVCCELCSKPFSAKGPTGYYDEQPICDRCLLESESQLGMLVALSSFTRNYARLADEEGPTANEAAGEMLAFARIYELFSARFGSPRGLDFAAFASIYSVS